MNHPELSFVVPMFNHLDYSKAMLASLQATLPPGLAHEIILVNDASTDDTRHWLSSLGGPELRVVHNENNVGFARAVNAGVAHSKGKVLTLLNNDLLLTPGWLDPMLEVIHNPWHNAGVVGNVQIRVADGALDHAGVQMSAAGQLQHVQALPDEGVENGQVFAVTGACCLVLREVFDAVGGFDRAFVNGCEDIDLCQKVKAKSKRIYMAYRSVVQHHVSLSRGLSDLQNERNSRHLFTRWRKEFKIELASVWLTQFQSDSQAQKSGVMDGQFTPALLATPHVLSRVVAESLLQLQECHWARTLDGVDENANLVERCNVHGLDYSTTHGAYLLDGTAELCMTGMCSVRNFFVCGRVLGGLGMTAITLTMVVNGIQMKTIELKAGGNFNVGVIAPVCLAGGINRFCVSVSGTVVVSHFVVDERVVGVGKSE